MFSKEAYINYFKEIQKIESKMLENIVELQKVINDSSAREILESIYNEEKNHFNLEEILIEAVKNDIGL